MSDDLPIKVTLDPAPAQAGAKKVVQAVSLIVDEAKKTNASIEDLKKQIAQLDKEAEKAAKAAKSLDFKQSVGAANQLFGLLNEKLKLTDGALGSIIGSATKFGALGAQVAGPWGAALGGALGIATDLSTQIEKLNQQALQSKLDALNSLQFIAEMKEIKGLLDGTNGAARDVKDRIAALYSDEGRAKKFFEPWEEGRKSIIETAQAAEAAKNVMVELRDISDRKARGEHVSPAEQQRLKDSGFTMAQYQHAIEEFTKAELALTLNKQSYGSVLKPILQAEQERAATLGKLQNALENENLTQSQRNAVLAEYNKLLGVNASAAAAARKEIEGYAKAILGAPPGIKPGSNAHAWAIEQAQREADIRSLDAQQQAIRNEALGITAQSMDFPTPAQINASAAGNGKRYPNDIADRLAAQHAEAQKLNDLIAGQLTNSVSALGDSLVEAAHGADVSWTSTFDSIAKSFEKMLLQAAAFKLLTGSVTGAAGADGNYGGLLGAILPGHADGAYYPPGGAGGPDSQLVAFRKSPWESVHVNTPSQEAMYRQGGSGARVVIENRIASGRDLLPLSYDEEYRVLNVIGKHASAIKGLIG